MSNSQPSSRSTHNIHPREPHVRTPPSHKTQLLQSPIPLTKGQLLETPSSPLGPQSTRPWTIYICIQSSEPLPFLNGTLPIWGTCSLQQNLNHLFIECPILRGGSEYQGNQFVVDMFLDDWVDQRPWIESSSNPSPRGQACCPIFQTASPPSSKNNTSSLCWEFGKPIAPLLKVFHQNPSLYIRNINSPRTNKVKNLNRRSYTKKRNWAILNQQHLTRYQLKFQ